MVVVGFHLCWWDVADLAVETTVVELFDVGEGRELDVFGVAPWSLAFDQLGLVERVDGLGEGVVGQSPTVPIEGLAPSSARRSVYAIDVYCLGSTSRRNTALLD